MMETNDFPVTITDEAARRLAAMLQRDGRENAFLRIGLKGGGCSGLEYVTEIQEEPRENDLVLEMEGLTVRCDPKSAKFLSGAVLDYSGNLMSGGFQFKNPNAARSCGCGTSFTPKV